ncbi:hypothetical protein O3G_MSEX013030, partial [Manduca sexta]
FELSDGTKQYQRRGLLYFGNKVFYRVSGTFLWVAPDGVEYEVAYYADNTDYHVLPKAHQPKLTSTPANLPNYISCL